MIETTALRTVRLSYLDWLRFLVVLSLAPFHAALSYTGMGVVYVYDTPVRDLILGGRLGCDSGPAVMRYFTIFMDNWFIHLLFLVSGVGAALSLKKRTAGRFMAERANRLLIPLLVGTLLFISVQSWLRALSFGTYSGGFFSFYPHFFNGSFTGPGSKGNFDYGHLWFLLYLFVFSALALPFFLILNRRGGSSRTFSAAKRLCGGSLILLPAVWIAALEAVFRPGWPGFQNLINDWANFTVYLSFFVFGFIAGSAPGLLESMERNRLTALLAGITAFIARLGVYRLFDVTPGWSAANMATQAFRGAAAWLIVVAAMGYGRRFLNRESRALSAARDLSFPLYLVHYVFLTAATYLLLGSGLTAWPRWAISVAGTWLCVALFTAAARHVPVVKDFFGLKRAGTTKLKPGVT